MGLRPAKCYSWDSPAYTRISNNPSDSYITGVPASKISHFDMGNLSGKFNTEVSVIAEDSIQIRHNALEASRVVVHQTLDKNPGSTNYRFKIRVYPHHVMRENVMASGAGADRVQEGMRNSFGKPSGRAARITAGQKVLSIYINENEALLKRVKTILRTALKKLPGSMKIVVKSIEE